ncbi:MAG: glycosyltransferase [Acidobacteriota bacterium]
MSWFDPTRWELMVDPSWRWLLEPSWALVILALYYLTLGILALYGLHRLLLVTLYWRHARRPLEIPAEPETWPRVTVQLPLYNERYVARRLLTAIAALDYPRDRLEIQVLDDSTDDTRDLVASQVDDLQRQGVPIVHLHRENREGFKAGALAAGLEQAQGELVAVFDADFIPGADFLRRTVPYFQDDGIGMVQTCWDHVNREYSLLTQAQAVLLDGHFLVEHAARHRSGRFFNFNGTGGVWRRQTIEEAGGWQHDTLTEDLDLSYRAQLAGWRFLFLPEVKTPSELPMDVHGFKNQQHRWTKGSVQTARKLLWRILRSRLPWTVKTEAFVHLSANFSYLLMIFLSLLVFPAMAVRGDRLDASLPWIDLPLLIGATGSVLLFYAVSQRARGKSWLSSFAWVPILMGLGIGLSVNNCRAVLEGMVERGGTFVRTPKYSIVDSQQRWQDLAYRARKNLSFLLEGFLTLYLALCLLLAAAWQMWLALPFLYLFFHGYGTMFLLSLLPRGHGSWIRAQS